MKHLDKFESFSAENEENEKIPLEAERRWLLSEINLKDQDYTKSDILQLYLPSEDDTVKRIRKVKTDGVESYILTEKWHVRKGVSKEKERPITKEEFYELSKSALTYIKKTRYTIGTPDGLHWEVDDLYEHNLKIVEVELPLKEGQSIDSYPLDVPDFIQVSIIKEITGEKEYSNKSLSLKVS